MAMDGRHKRNWPARNKIVPETTCIHCCSSRKDHSDSDATDKETTALLQCPVVYLPAVHTSGLCWDMICHRGTEISACFKGVYRQRMVRLSRGLSSSSLGSDVVEGMSEAQKLLMGTF